MADDLPDWMGLTLFKAVDEDGNLVTVLVDASGAMFAVMKGEYNDVLQTVKLDADHRMIARVIGSISDTVDDFEFATIDATTYHLDFDVVPAGKLYKITVIGARDSTTTCASVRFNKRRGGEDIVIGGVDSPNKDYYSFWQGEVWLKAGEQIRVTFYGATVSDFVRADLVGVEIDAE